MSAKSLSCRSVQPISTTTKFMRLVFVDGRGSIAPSEAHIRPSTKWEEFLKLLKRITAPSACYIIGLRFRLPHGEGLTLKHGDWYYRILKPFDYTTQCRNIEEDQWEIIRRTGVDKEEWTLVSTKTQFIKMKEKVFHRRMTKGAWIEVTHQMQNDRDDIAAKPYLPASAIDLRRPIGQPVFVHTCDSIPVPASPRLAESHKEWWINGRHLVDQDGVGMVFGDMETALEIERREKRSEDTR